MPTLNLTKIPPEERAATWSRLLDQHPAEAAWVRDEMVQLMRKEFDAENIVELPDDEP